MASVETANCGMFFIMVRDGDERKKGGDGTYGCAEEGWRDS